MKTKTKFLTLKQASVQMGIPLAHLKIVKQHCPEGFTVNQVHADKVRKYYDEHKSEIEVQEEKSLEALKKIKLGNDIKLQELAIEEAKKQMVQIKDVEEFMLTFGTQLSAVLKDRLTKELPPRVTGLSEEAVNKLCREYYNELVKRLQTDLKNWNGGSQ
jgi:hypothetical protein